MQSYFKGKVVAYSEVVHAGAVQGEDGKVYIFSKKDWASSQEPQAGIDVFFIPQHERAKDVRAEIDA